MSSQLTSIRRGYCAFHLGTDTHLLPLKEGKSNVISKYLLMPSQFLYSSRSSKGSCNPSTSSLLAPPAMQILPYLRTTISRERRRLRLQASNAHDHSLPHSCQLFDPHQANLRAPPFHHPKPHYSLRSCRNHCPWLTSAKPNSNQLITNNEIHFNSQTSHVLHRTSIPENLPTSALSTAIVFSWDTLFGGAFMSMTEDWWI